MNTKTDIEALMRPRITKKFAWLPKYVNTWRPMGTTAIVWLQSYYVKDNERPYVNHLGFLSYEFYN